MKRIILLSVFSMLFFPGCAVNTGPGGITGSKTEQKNTLSIIIEQKDYEINDAKKSVAIDFQIHNGLSDEIFFEDTTCGNPFKIYKLSSSNKWKEVTSDLFGGCMGLSGGKATPLTLASHGTKNSSGSFRQDISTEGTYKMEFIYYLNKNDFDKNMNQQSAFSNQFVVNKNNAGHNSVVEACANEAADITGANERQSMITQCLYIGAKNIAVKDTNLAIELCKEIEKYTNSFDGCYDGVALMLKKAGMTDKINTVCNSHTDPIKAERCLNSVRK